MKSVIVIYVKKIRGKKFRLNIFSFQTDFNRRHKQLNEWVRRGVVPNPNSEPLVGRGQLTSVWLGGLANPAALVTSLKHEKAAMVGCRVDEVKLYLFFF